MGVAVGAGFGGLGVSVGLGVGVGVGVAATTSGDGTDAGELATSALATVLAAGVTGLVIVEPRSAEVVDVGGELSADVAPADDGCLLVHAARAAAHRTATTKRAGVGLVVRSRLAIVPG